MHPTNTRLRLQLTDANGSAWSYLVRARVSADVDGAIVAVTEVTESPWRDPKHVVRFVPVAEFYAIAATNGLSPEAIVTKLAAKAGKKAA